MCQKVQRTIRDRLLKEHTWISTLMMVRGATKRVPVMAADSGQNWMVSCRKGLITQSPSICSTQPYDCAILQTPVLQTLASPQQHTTTLAARPLSHKYCEIARSPVLRPVISIV